MSSNKVTPSPPLSPSSQHIRNLQLELRLLTQQQELLKSQSNTGSSSSSTSTNPSINSNFLTSTSQYIFPLFYYNLLINTVWKTTQKLSKYVIIISFLFLMLILAVQPNLLLELMRTFSSLVTLFFGVAKIAGTGASISLSTMNCILNPVQCAGTIFWSLSWTRNENTKPQTMPIITPIQPTSTWSSRSQSSTRQTVSPSRPTYTAGGIPYWNFTEAEEGYALWTNALNRNLADSFKITNGPGQHQNQYEFASGSNDGEHAKHNFNSNSDQPKSKDLMLPLSSLIESSVALTSAISYIDRRSDISLRDDVVTKLMPRLGKTNTLTRTVYTEYKKYNVKWLQLVESMTRDSYDAGQKTLVYADEFQAIIDEVDDTAGEGGGGVGFKHESGKERRYQPIILEKGHRYIFNPIRLFRGKIILKPETLIEHAHRIYLLLMIERKSHIHRISIAAREMYTDSQNLLRLIDSVNINIDHLKVQLSHASEIKHATRKEYQNAIDAAEEKRKQRKCWIFWTCDQTEEEKGGERTLQEKIKSLVADIAKLDELGMFCKELQCMLERDDELWKNVLGASDEFLAGTRPWSEFQGWLEDIERDDNMKGLSIFGFWMTDKKMNRLNDDNKKIQQANHFVKEVRWWAGSRVNFAKELEGLVENIVGDVEGRSWMAGEGLREARMKERREG